MTCPNCGAVNNEGTSFCVSCGTKLEAAPSANQMAAEPVAAPVAPAPEAPEKKSKKGLFIKIGIAAAAVILLVVLILVGVNACGGKKIDFAKMPLFYSTDGETFLLAAKDKEGKLVADEDDYAGRAMLSMDGKTLFFGMDADNGEYDLYYRNTSKKDETANVKIESGISWYIPTPDGKNVFYIKNDKLFKANLKNKAVQLGKDVNSDSIEIAPDMNGVIYENEDGEVFYSNGKYEIELSDNENGANAFFSDNGKKIFIYEYEKAEEPKDSDEFDSYDEYYEYLDNFDYSTKYQLLVCSVGKGKKPEKVADGVKDWASLDNYSKIYVVNEDDELVLYKNGKESGGVILEDVSSVFWYGEEGKEEVFAETFKEDKDENETTYSLYYVDGVKSTELASGYHGRDTVDDENMTVFGVYETDYNKDTGATEYDYTYYVRNKNKVTEVDLSDEDDMLYVADDKVLYVIEDVDDDSGLGTLKKFNVTKSGLSKEVEITDDVYEIGYLEASGNLGVIMGKKHDELSVYNGKKLVQASDDLYGIAWSAAKDGTLYLREDYNENKGTYTLSKFDGKKTVEVASDVRSVVVLDESLVYFINEDDELFRSNGKAGKEKFIDDIDDGSLIHPNSYMDYLSYYYTDEELTEMILG